MTLRQVTRHSLLLTWGILAAAPALGWVYVGPVVNPANGHDYYLLGGGTWEDSEAEANALRGHLVTINDQAEQDWVWSTFSPLAMDNYLWIGLNDLDQEGTWVWSSGQPVTYENWAPGQPDNDINQNRVLMQPGQDGQWDDAWQQGWVCGVVEVSYKPGDCDRDGDVDLDDLSLLVACMTGPGGGVPYDCDHADLDADGDVDLADFGIFQPQCAPGQTRMGGYGDSDCLPGAREGYPCEVEYVEVEVDGTTVNVVHRNAGYNCCPDDIMVSLTVEGSDLILTETEIATMPCPCMCCYDVSSSIVDVEPGYHLVRYCWSDDESGEQVCEGEMVYVQ